MHCSQHMFGLFKKDPIKKLEKEHAKLLEQAFQMSKIDRTKSDELTAKAADIEAKIQMLKSQ